MSQYNTWCYFTSKLKQIEKIDLSENEAIVFVNYGNYCEPMNTRFEGTNIYGIEILTSKCELEPSDIVWNLNNLSSLMLL